LFSGMTSYKKPRTLVRGSHRELVICNLTLIASVAESAIAKLFVLMVMSFPVADHLFDIFYQIKYLSFPQIAVYSISTTV
jgi:hypothetical protein